MATYSTDIAPYWHAKIVVPDTPTTMALCNGDYVNGIDFIRFPFTHSNAVLPIERWYMIGFYIYESRTRNCHVLKRTPVIRAKVGIDEGAMGWETCKKHHLWAPPIWPKVSYDSKTRHFAWAQSMEDYVKEIVETGTARVRELDPSVKLAFDTHRLTDYLNKLGFKKEAKE